MEADGMEADGPELVGKPLHCKCGCSVEVKVPRYYFAPGEIMESTGWQYIVRGDSHSWLCSTCYKEAKELMEKVAALVGHKNFHISSFFHGDSDF